MKRSIVLPAAVVGLCVGLASAAQAQSGSYAPRSARAVGYNCEALQSGFSGVQPFSCPLPGARRLGTRCYCEQPVAAFSGYQPPLIGEVVP